MFNKIFEKAYTIRKHTNAPLLEERLKYLQYLDKCGRSLSTMQSIARHLLRIVDYLKLEVNGKITIEKIEIAADNWARYQSNHPRKRVLFSKCSKERFTQYAIDWLKKLNRLERLPEEKIPLFNKIYTRRKALKRHTSAPLLKERLKYLRYLADNGAVYSNLRRIAGYLLVIMKYLNLNELRLVSVAEIEVAADNLTKDREGSRRKSDYSNFAKARFIYYASSWFKMLGYLKEQSRKPIPFEEYLRNYIAYIRQEQGLSVDTIKYKFSQLQDFLINISKRNKNFKGLTPLIIEEILKEKYDIGGYSRRTIRWYASIIRTFLRYAENQDWCQKGLADSIKVPRIYRYEALPYSPSWNDVKRLLANSKSDHPTDVRDYAIVMLLSVYGMRCSEVTNLRLEDLDWKKERIYLRRAKRSKPQIFPLSKIVGEVILRYLKEVRQNCCSLKEVFICMRAPYRTLKSAAIYQIVSRRLRPLCTNIKHYGPHALRHACATHLINKGVSLKEISDHLGHQELETTRIYTKVDLVNLRKVAEFKLGGIL